MPNYDPIASERAKMEASEAAENETENAKLSEKPLFSGTRTAGMEAEAVAGGIVPILQVQMENESDWRKRASIAARIAKLNLDTY